MNMCACGQPLHYADENVRGIVDRLVARMGEHMRVTCAGRTWLVPRHYVALHGLKGADLGTAALPPFEEVTAGRGK